MLASLAGNELTPEQKEKAGSIVHYGFGTAMGALYGVAMELLPRRLRDANPALSGAGIGSALFVGAHEVAVPVLGYLIARFTNRYPITFANGSCISPMGSAGRNGA